MHQALCQLPEQLDISEDKDLLGTLLIFARMGWGVAIRRTGLLKTGKSSMGWLLLSKEVILAAS